MRIQMRAILVAASVMLVHTPNQAPAGSTPGEHEHLCSEIAQRHQIVRQPMDQREVDFFLFDAAERG